MERRELSCHFADFEIPSHSYIVEVLGSLTPKTCDLDSIPTSEVKQHVLELAPIIARIVSASLASGEFPSLLKTSIVLFVRNLRNQTLTRKVIRIIDL